MYQKLVGYKLLDFISPEGKQIKGKKLYLLTPEPGEDIVGDECDILFVRDDFKTPPLKPGMMLDIDYTRKGRVVEITTASTAKQLNISTQ